MVRIKLEVMIVCVCHRVSDRDIARAAQQGCASYDELQEQLRVGTACGACADCAHRTFDSHRQHPPSVAAVAVSWIGRGAAHAPALMAAPLPMGLR
jgi:bacterioferritin-associated ferredoxin